MDLLRTALPSQHLGIDRPPSTEDTPFNRQAGRRASRHTLLNAAVQIGSGTGAGPDRM
ncbi:hypothetical protein MBT84_02975 [Streptomyces sp. MBT84]|nr:hypothetical protein [Streptomyces sp. MBT84]